MYLKNKKITFFVVIGVVVTVVVMFMFYSASPENIHQEKIIHIPDGYSLTQTAQLIESENIIRSKNLLRLYMQVKNMSPKSGYYQFFGLQDLQNIAFRLHNADYGDVYKSITFPEGITNKQILNNIQQADISIEDIDNIKEKLQRRGEGVFFPDTYFLLPDTSAGELLDNMHNHFKKKFKEAKKESKLNKKDEEIVIMASLIEKEAANSLHQKQMISGILWKRINEGMLLQVDAPFVYERGKGSAELTYADLQKKSTFNTYVNKGLTPTAIGNPGYDSLYAAAHPVVSPYYFYLHGKNGKIYYGKNYREHLKNKRMYLR